MSRRIELALRRQSLQLKSAGHRLSLAHHVSELKPVFDAADAVKRGVAFLRAHPEWVVGAMIVVSIVRPRFVWRWVRRGFLAWELAHRLLDRLAQSQNRA